MTKLIKKTETGQAIALLVLMLVGMIGIVGVAIDGGDLFQERRSSQNAADNAALSGAQALCTGGNPVTSAFASAFANGYDNDLATNFVTVNNPPSQGAFLGNAEYVEVKITSTREPGFSQLVFSGPFQTSVYSLAHCAPAAIEPVGDYGILALNPSDKDAFKNNGNGTLKMTGGGVYVNSNHASMAMVTAGNGVIIAPDIKLVGGYTEGSPGSISPTPTTGVPALSDPLAEVQEPTNPGGTCTTVDMNSGSQTIDPGLYCSITVKGGALTMNPGVYYIKPGNMDVNKGSVSGNGVMIFMDGGQISLSGGDFNLSAPSSGSYKGMAIFMKRSSAQPIVITANASSTITGTIYGPASELVLAGSGSANPLHSQVIVSLVKVSGSAALEIAYDPDENYKLSSPALVELIN
ncbi:MAG: hypothetical protein DWG76_00625 [Chloroflexi bacterium]|nr:Tad domain-containing protein [Chloroflexota bacterium]MQC25942.1 hypothetical protein [Chloroflexota bacterium]